MSTDSSFSWSVRICFGELLVLQIICILIAALRTGQFSDEKGKKGFNVNKVREINWKEIQKRGNEEFDLLNEENTIV